VNTTTFKLKLKAITNGPATLTDLTVDVTIPISFKEKTHQLSKIDKRLSGTTTETIEQQILSYIDDTPSIVRNIMDEHDLYQVIDYEVVKEKKPKAKKPAIKLWSEKSGLMPEVISIFDSTCKDEKLNEQLKHDFIAVYKEMKETIGDLPIHKQIEIIFKTIGVGYMAQTEAYKKLSSKEEKTDNTKLLS
jgi:hypothetical protein